jgi:hypothetical protein
VPSGGAYPKLASSKEHEMTRFVRLIGSVSLACALFTGGAARGDEPPAALAEERAPDPPAVTDAARLAESYFDETERFDAFLTYEARRGPARALFTVARRWRGGLAELLFDIREPVSFGKWAALLTQTRGGSDDLFVYVDKTGSVLDRSVRRLSASQLERHAFFSLVALGDYRPLARGEVTYEMGPDERLNSAPCHVVIARPPRRYLGYDHLELVFAADSKLLVETRIFSSDREVRRLSISPADYEDFGGRLLPKKRIARGWADDGETEILLVRAVETADLPDELFSHLNLRVQHFPEF